MSQPIRFVPECQVCLRNLAPIWQTRQIMQVTQSRRTCPKCRRRWLIWVKWLPDRLVEATYKRITDVPWRPR